MHVFGLVLITLLAGPAEKARPANEGQQTTAERSDPAKRANPSEAPAPAKPPVAVDPQKQPPGNASYNTGSGDDWRWKLSDAINAVIAVATIATLGTTLWIIWMTSRANRGALKLTNDALNETKLSNQLTQDSIHLAHRPSLHLKEMQPLIETGEADSRVYRTQAVLINTGSDTAHDVRIRARFTDAAPDARFDTLDVPTAYGDVGAGLAVTVKVLSDIDAVPLSYPIYVYFAVRYRDEFGYDYRYTFAVVNEADSWSRYGVERHSRSAPPTPHEPGGAS